MVEIIKTAAIVGVSRLRGIKRNQETSVNGIGLTYTKYWQNLSALSRVKAFSYTFINRKRKSKNRLTCFEFWLILASACRLLGVGFFIQYQKTYNRKSASLKKSLSLTKYFAGAIRSKL